MIYSLIVVGIIQIFFVTSLSAAIDVSLQMKFPHPEKWSSTYRLDIPTNKNP
jgi:hypothetical protein